MDQVMLVAGGITAIAAAVAAVCRWVVVPLLKAFRLLALFFVDWFGEESRDGVPARPGMMERMATVEHATQRAEFHLGNGSPIPLRNIVEKHTAMLSTINQSTKSE